MREEASSPLLLQISQCLLDALRSLDHRLEECRARKQDQERNHGMWGAVTQLIARELGHNLGAPATPSKSAPPTPGRPVPLTPGGEVKRRRQRENCLASIAQV